jgi:hypothetical protein
LSLAFEPGFGRWERHSGANEVVMKDSSPGSAPVEQRSAVDPSEQKSKSDEMGRRLQGLSELSSLELREEWRRLYRSDPPRLSRDLLIRALAYRIQEIAYGGLSKATRRTLESFAEQLRADGRLTSRPSSQPRSGQRLVREWRGKTHTVTALEDGFFYCGQTYPSLSAIARLITGTRWSGPRFFGLEHNDSRKESRDV